MATPSIPVHVQSLHVDCEFFSPSCDPGSFWLYLGTSLALVTTAGLMAGLTMGLLSLDMLNMRILEMEGSPLEKMRAARVLPILSRHHLLLVTLMLVNACANEALPIFLSKLVPESISIILSVTCVLLFGEILPSAVFTGPNQLKIAAFLTPAVKMLMLITSPISYPIAKLLDCWLGSDHDVVRYKRKELKALVALQRETAELRRTYMESHEGDAAGASSGAHGDGDHASQYLTNAYNHRHPLHSHGYSNDQDQDHSNDQQHSQRPDDRRDNETFVSNEDGTNSSTGLARSTSSAEAAVYTGGGDGGGGWAQRRGRTPSAQSTRLHVDEVTIIHGALDLTAKTVREVMIPMKQVYMLQSDTKLDDNRMADILASGHSRIPIFSGHRSNIVGLLLVKRLIVVDPADERAVHDLALRKPIVVSPEESCYYVLNEFQKGRSHIAMVTPDAKRVIQCWQDGEDIPEDVTFVGIITIEDVIEELIQEEIEDESDVYVHGIVDYWRAKAVRRARNVEIGKPSYVKKRLKLLAERARVRVKNRGRGGAGSNAKKGRSSTPASPRGLQSPIQIKIIPENAPLESTPLLGRLT